MHVFVTCDYENWISNQKSALSKDLDESEMLVLTDSQRQSLEVWECQSGLCYGQIERYGLSGRPRGPRNNPHRFDRIVRRFHASSSNLKTQRFQESHHDVSCRPNGLVEFQLPR